MKEGSFGIAAYYGKVFIFFIFFAYEYVITAHFKVKKRNKPESYACDGDAIYILGKKLIIDFEEITTSACALTED